MNQIIVSGNLGEDPQSAVTPSGRAVARFSICSKMKYTDTNGEQKEIQEWHRCIAWGKIADDVSTFLSKGDYIMIMGREQSRSYTDKNNIKRTITEINIQSIWMFISGKRRTRRWHSRHRVSRIWVRKHMKKKYHSKFICPVCGKEYNSCIYCHRVKRPICQNHCESCEWFRKISGCWYCLYPR